jgi:hypothetical protein
MSTTSYGVPLGIPEPDTNSDMSRNAADLTQFDAWISTSTYDVRGDTELDGDVDTADKNLAIAYGPKALGWGALSWVNSCKAFTGSYALDNNICVQHSRLLDYRIGRYLNRYSHSGGIDYRANLYRALVSGGAIGLAAARCRTVKEQVVASAGGACSQLDCSDCRAAFDGLAIANWAYDCSDICSQCSDFAPCISIASAPKPKGSCTGAVVIVPVPHDGTVSWWTFPVGFYRTTSRGECTCDFARPVSPATDFH